MPAWIHSGDIVERPSVQVLALQDNKKVTQFSIRNIAFVILAEFFAIQPFFVGCK